MKPVNGNSAQRRIQSSRQHPSEEIPTNAVFGFPVSVNQFNVLQTSESAVSISREQIQDRLVDQEGQDWQDYRLREELLDRELWKHYLMEESSTLYQY